MAGAAVLGEEGDRLEHQRDVGPIALVAPFLLDREQPCLGECPQVEGQVGRRDLEGAGDVSGDAAGTAGFDEQAKDVEPDAGGKGLENLQDGGFVHRRLASSGGMVQ